MAYSPLELLFLRRARRDFALHRTQYKLIKLIKLIKMKFAISMITLAPAIASTKASLASW
jgi:hypothetical protein